MKQGDNHRIENLRGFPAAATMAADAAGRASVVVPSAAPAAGTGDRWIHATAGLTHPLAEWIRPVE